ncbi:MAG TPA: hypothetical protein VN838_19625 [Bradyrhizobium sp.]|nr:hypothetical protein [Bradyrhizobium sp.]
MGDGVSKADLTGGSPAPSEPLHVVILLHGILTRAFWFDIAEPLLAAVPNVAVERIGYGYFAILRFLFPFFTRRGPERRVINQIREIIWKYDQRGQRITISVIAHSFGSYTIRSVLENTNDIDLHNLILCGSVLPQRYDFGRIKRKIHNFIVNDVGAKDFWPIFARIASFGYGDSGTFGFVSNACRDRYYDFYHSDFFSDAFIRDYWVPIFSENKIEPSGYVRTRENQSALTRFTAFLPSSLIPFMACAALFWTSYSYYPSLTSPTGVICSRWPDAPVCSDVVDVKPGGPIAITHYLGEPITGFKLTISNQTGKPVDAKLFKLKLSSPDQQGMEFFLFAVASNLNDPASDAKLSLTTNPGETRNYYLWWTSQPWKSLEKKLKQSLKSLPDLGGKLCKVRRPLEKTESELLAAVVGENLKWAEGRWEYKFQGVMRNYFERELASPAISIEDIEDMKNVEQRYKNCEDLKLQNINRGALLRSVDDVSSQ